MALSAPEASALVDWVSCLDQDLPEAVALVTSRAVSLDYRSLLPVMLQERIESKTASNDFVKRHASDLSRIVAHLLDNTEPDTASSFSMSMPIVLSELGAYAERDLSRRLRLHAVSNRWTMRPD